MKKILFMAVGLIALSGITRAEEYAKTQSPKIEKKAEFTKRDWAKLAISSGVCLASTLVSAGFVPLIINLERTNRDDRAKHMTRYGTYEEWKASWDKFGLPDGAYKVWKAYSYKFAAPKFSDYEVPALYAVLPYFMAGKLITGERKFMGSTLLGLGTTSLLAIVSCAYTIKKLCQLRSAKLLESKQEKK